jgi:acetylglutamate kinase
MIKEKCHIVKIGGQLIDDPSMLASFMKSFHHLEGLKCLVHGGGKAGSKMLKRLDIPVVYHEGRRITDLQTMEVVTMVYAGDINKKIVAGLQAIGCTAIGLSGCDGNVIRAQKRMVKDIDYGYAGDIIQINTSLISQLFSIGLVPVFNPITHDREGTLLNTNADTIAATLGAVLSSNYAVDVHYCFDLPGVLYDINDKSSIINHINEKKYTAMLSDGSIADGMIPKMTNAFNALRGGANSVTIGDHQHFSVSSFCTTISL